MYVTKNPIKSVRKCQTVYEGKWAPHSKWYQDSHIMQRCWFTLVMSKIKHTQPLHQQTEQTTVGTTVTSDPPDPSSSAEFRPCSHTKSLFLDSYRAGGPRDQGKWTLEFLELWENKSFIHTGLPAEGHTGKQWHPLQRFCPGTWICYMSLDF